MNPWDDLPNTRLIDQVIASLKAHPDQWAALGSSWNISCDSMRNSMRNGAWIAAWNMDRNAACDAVCNSAWDVARDVAYIAACDAVIALVVYDDSAKFVDMSASELEMWATLSHDPGAVLLLPAVQAFESINKSIV